MGLDLQALTDSSAPAERRERAFAELSRLVQIFVRARMAPSVRSGGGGRESIDITQSIAKSFVEDVGHGRLAFENEAALMAYLKLVVRTKLAEAKRRDEARLKPVGGPVAVEAPAAGGSPSVTVEFDQAVERAWEELSDDERELVRLRRAGVEWGVIAKQMGESEAALRKRWSRMQSESEKRTAKSENEER